LNEKKAQFTGFAEEKCPDKLIWLSKYTRGRRGHDHMVV